MTSTEPTASTDGSQNATDSAPAPAATVPSTSTAPVKLDTTSAAALQLALGAENAAIWAYSLVAVHDQGDSDTINKMISQHLVRRDAAETRLADGGVTPTPPAPAYATPAATDVKSARALAISIENDCAAGWLSVVAGTDNTDLRGFATSALTEAAVRLVQWKQLAKISPATTPFPGQQTG